MPEKSIIYTIPTAYCPEISYIHKILSHSTVYINDIEMFQKQTFRNRCFIMGPNNILRLSVPVERYIKMKTPTKDIHIDNNCNWKRIHWKSLEAAYNNAPFFLYYKDIFQSIIFKNHKFLIDLNMEILGYIFKMIKATVSFNFLSEANISDNFKLQNLIKEDKSDASIQNFPYYYQVFEQNHSFVPNLSIIDLLSNEGPSSRAYFEQLRGACIKY